MASRPMYSVVYSVCKKMGFNIKNTTQSQYSIGLKHENSKNVLKTALAFLVLKLERIWAFCVAGVLEGAALHLSAVKVPFLNLIFSLSFGNFLQLLVLVYTC